MLPRLRLLQPSAILIAVLLLLRIPYLAGIRFITRPDYPVWLLPSEQALTYLATAALLYIDRRRLQSRNISALSLALFLLAPLLDPITSRAFGLLALSTLDIALRTFQTAVGLGLAVALFRRREDLSLGSDTFAGVLAGVISSTVMAVGFSAYATYEEFGQLTITDPRIRPPAGPLYLSALLLAQPRGAAIAEEPLFRGFLWGELRQARWRSGAIWGAQAMLFWIGHIYYLGREPFSFWVIVPLAGMVFGWLARGSRSILPGMAAHTIVNGLTVFLTTRTMYWGSS